MRHATLEKLLNKIFLVNMNFLGMGTSQTWRTAGKNLLEVNIDNFIEKPKKAPK